MTELPDRLQINAFAPDAANEGPVDPEAKRRLLTGGLALRDVTAAPTPIDPRDWRDERVGWGVVLPDDDALSSADKARAADAPEPLQALIAHRRGVVLRYRPDRVKGTLRRHYADGTTSDILTASQAWGIGRGQLPHYLLICGSPVAIPWALQFQLQGDCFVGRIDLAGPALERYVDRLIDDWGEAAADPRQTLVWATDEPGDITRLMRDSVAAPLHQRYTDDGELTAVFIDGRSGAATGAALAAALAAGRPGFVATTSHGMTGPLGDLARMRADLGLLVDSDFQTIQPDRLMAQWKPDGVIWYAHACCSAGSQAVTGFAGLVAAGSGVDRILQGVAACGQTIAPFPQALLSSEKPAKAFVGHVEPTFDWSIRHNRTGQYLTIPLMDSFYQRLFLGEPVGMAVDSCRRFAAGLINAWYSSDVDELRDGQSRAGDILALKLMANDWRSFVLLGDPTCRIDLGGNARPPGP